MLVVDPLLGYRVMFGTAGLGATELKEYRVQVDVRSKAAWEKAGGTFILHNRAVHTVAALKRLGVI